jgi:hypothetical protein
MEGIDWIDLKQYRNKWRSVVSTVHRNFRFLQMRRMSLLAKGTKASQQGLCSIAITCPIFVIFQEE